MTKPSWRPVPQREYKERDRQVTSAMMSAVRSRDNKAEVVLRKALWHLGYRYRIQSPRYKGRPDLVLPKYRLMIFVDGDFWHGRALREGGEEQLRQVIRGKRFEWWRDKLSRNIARDEEVTKYHQSEGWNVLRIWESDVLTNLTDVVDRVIALIKAQKESSN
jgi:DNA mismatch endonuclease, patch repair protein